MVSERTCGECRDCRHWKQWDSDKTSGDCTHSGSFALHPKEHFGCVLFEAKPAPKVAAFLALNESHASLYSFQDCVTLNPGHIRDIREFTHIYSVGMNHYLFRYEKEINP